MAETLGFLPLLRLVEDDTAALRFKMRIAVAAATKLVAE
jgi:hypothetical protein